MDSLSRLVKAYLAHRRSLGFALVKDHVLLPLFARFHQRTAPGQPLRTDVILKWATQPGTGNRNYYVKRLAIVRSFAKYCAAFEPRTQIPDYRLLGRGYQRITPHIYSQNEIRLILQRARGFGTYRFPLGPRTAETLLGLIACSGLRIGEALRLRCDDFDPVAGTLRVRASKFSPERLLPLHSSTQAALQNYLRARQRAEPRCDHFFVNRFGLPLRWYSAHRMFRRASADITAKGAHARPRIHDLRHTFATRHIARWNQDKAPVAHHLLLLSRYLGHQSFSETWWYVSANPKTLQQASRRFEQFSQEA